jgi:hypothetical protein
MTWHGIPWKEIEDSDVSARIKFRRTRDRLLRTEPFAMAEFDPVAIRFALRRTFTDRSTSAAGEIGTSRSPGFLHRSTRIQP